MANNLIKLTRRHHPVDAPTALAKLSEIVAETGTLTDLPHTAVRFEQLPPPPPGTEYAGIELFIRLRRV